MTKIIAAVRNMPVELREDLTLAVQDVAAWFSICAFVGAVILWAPELANILH